MKANKGLVIYKIIGITGTSRGMVRSQMDAFTKFLEDHPEIVSMSHGDCVGADKQCHYLLRHVNPTVEIVIHPPIQDRLRAYCQGDIILPKKDYLVRNHDIVDNIDLLLVFPRERQEQVRSGTWATYRYAKKIGKEYKVILP